MFGVLIYTAWLLAVASSHPLSAPKAACPPFSKGTINIASYQLYPENVDFDEQTCLLWYKGTQENHGILRTATDIGSLYNASVVVYDPYKAAVVKTIEFPNITRTVPFHIGGVAWDPYLGSKRGTNKTADEITILVDAAAAHETAGRDVSGDNYIIRYDARAGRVLWTTNLTRVSRGRYGGPQDVEHDAAGNIYVLGTYPGTLQRIPRSGGVVEEWYVPTTLDTTGAGYTGFAASGDTLLVADAQNHSATGGALVRFDMGAARGTPTAVPIAYPRGAQSEVIRPGDAIYLPPRYASEVLVVAEHGAGVSVLRAAGGGRQKWRRAEFLGRVPNPPEVAASGGVVTAAVEIAGSVFLVEEWFTDPLVPGTSAGNRSSFPLVDITAQLDALVKAR